MAIARAKIIEHKEKNAERASSTYCKGEPYQGQRWGQYESLPIMLDRICPWLAMERKGKSVKENGSDCAFSCFSYSSIGNDFCSLIALISALAQLPGEPRTV
jgi:hypothetical protein